MLGKKRPSELTSSDEENSIGPVPGDGLGVYCASEIRMGEAQGWSEPVNSRSMRQGSSAGELLIEGRPTSPG